MIQFLDWIGRQTGLVHVRSADRVGRGRVMSAHLFNTPSEIAELRTADSFVEAPDLKR